MSRRGLRRRCERRRGRGGAGTGRPAGDRLPEGGTEPFGLLTLLPILLIAAGALLALPADAIRLRAGIAIYAAATSWSICASAIGSNIARLGTFLAAPLAALVWWRRKMALLVWPPCRSSTSAGRLRSAT